MSEELSLVIKNQQAIAGIRHIDWNKDELIERVRAVTAKYKGLVYTDDDITNARTDRAELNAIKNSISDSRIQVKKFVMAPYDQFEAEVAEVTNLIIEAVKPIDEAIKTHDENQKADKKKQLVAYFDSIIGNLAESVTFERVFDPKMVNASTSMKKAKEGIADGVQQIRTNIETINTVVSEPYRSFAVANYLQTICIPDNGRDKRTEKTLSPQAGPQTAFMASKADIVIYGGAAGGGKTYSVRHRDACASGELECRTRWQHGKGPGGCRVRQELHGRYAADMD